MYECTASIYIYIYIYHYSRLKHVKTPTSGVFAIMLFVAAMFNETENDDLTETFGAILGLSRGGKIENDDNCQQSGISQNRVG